MMVRYSAVPSLCCGGAPGAIQALTFSFHLPTIFAIFWCSGPGVAAFMYFSMIARSSGLGAFLASSAEAAAAARRRNAASFMGTPFQGAENNSDGAPRPPFLRVH